MNNLGGWAIDKEVYDWIVSNIEPGETIIELGSGTGTVELAKIYNVITIEHDRKWLNKTKSATYIHAPIVNGWYQPSKIKLPVDYKLIIIDGPPGHIGRNGILKNLNLFNLDATIIIDDTHRQAELDIANILIKKLPDKEVVKIKSADKEAVILI